MEETKKHRKLVYLNYYTDEDYDQIVEKLPELIRESEIKASQVIEPTIDEKREILNIIKRYISDTKRKVYGGTALNELLKAVNPKDAIYDDYTFNDIEFYSPTPIVDAVKICNILYKKGYKYVTAKEAQHEESYTIFVNIQKYCDITYVPIKVYNGIKTHLIDNINYIDPHFMLIDYLRMFTDPMNSSWRWEKSFKREYLLLKDYPIEYYDQKIEFPIQVPEIKKYISKLKDDFLYTSDVKNITLISGFEAYNFFVKHAIGDREVAQMARTSYPKSRNLLVTVPFLDLVSVKYIDTVIETYNYLRKNVEDPSKLSLDEYQPLFQFTSYSVIINYNDIPVVRIFEADGMCIPNIKTTKEYMYVSFQYLFMSMLINKFRSHLDKNKHMYFNYGIAISNLIKARDIYLTDNNLGIINKSIFGEFKISCVGSTISFLRSGILRKIKRKESGKFREFTYTPESFFKKSEEDQAKFDPAKFLFKNTSGNKIYNVKNRIFHIDADGNISVNNNLETDSESENENIESDQSEKSNNSP